MPALRLPSLFCLLSLLIATGSAAEPETTDNRQPLDYGRDIRPILSNACFQCHGTDENTREAGLRLDVRDVAVTMKAIVAGSPGKSELIARITSDDEYSVMPPPEANKTLSASDIATLKRWIREGAEYSDHWAFERIEKPEVPTFDPERHPEAEGWTRNEVDAFVLRKLHVNGLEPSPVADREVLIRRLTQDLTGLLPSPEETNAFVNDTRPDAYERLVERLLRSPHYGERWGRHWLDQARYADSHGYTIDGARVMWPYRDWVIWAHNNDLPFDEFTIQQLAGDLLPDPSLRQQIATAFHRNTMINQEGGVKPDQYRHEALVDRVNTTGAVWLGLTVGCAQCHSHKFDPLSHEEYYRLYALFNDAVDANNVGPTVPVREGEVFGWSDEQKDALARIDVLKREVKELEDKLAEQKLTEQNRDWRPADITEGRTQGGGTLKPLDDGSRLAVAPLAKNAAHTVTVRSAASDKPSSIAAIRLRVLTDPSLPNNGPGTAGNGNFVLTAFEVRRNGKRVPIELAVADHSQSGYPVTSAIDGDKNTGWAINTNGEQAKAGKKMNAPHHAIFVLEQPLALGDGTLTITLRHDRNEDYQIGRFALDFANATPETNANPAADRIALKRKKQELKTLGARLPGAGKAVAQMIVEAKSTPETTFRLDRGDFLSPDRKLGPLKPGVPSAIQTLDASTDMTDRLAFARWLVSRDNPLTARVTVNRVWAKYFGIGLVETENDFGFQGTHPSHADLLDWLAVTFIERGWSLKELHRVIVLSATYRQSSRVTEELLERDPRNRLLARQSRFRVEAEIVRDQALAASGLLTTTVGGPSVYPPQPAGVYAFTQNKKRWPTETGPNRYRRTMYTMFYRSAPYPLLSTFDAPDFSVVCTRRVRSNTPLQSLTLANDVVFRELAIGMADRMLGNSNLATDRERLTHLFRLALTRTPTPDEITILTQFLERERQRFVDDPMNAVRFLAEPVDVKKPVPDAITDQAAWSSVARVLMNTDEFVSRN